MNSKTLEIERWSDAERKRMVEAVAKLPSPKRVAESLREASLLALINAQRNCHNEFLLRHSERGSAAAKELVEAGAVEIGGVFISNFGMAVRREALKMVKHGELG